jgi:predicted kinase
MTLGSILKEHPEWADLPIPVLLRLAGLQHHSIVTPDEPITGVPVNTLIMTVGLPRSGKSTWARQQGHPIVNPDAIRLVLYGRAYQREGERMVWTVAHYMVEALFMAGHQTVILDATNCRESLRKEWRNRAWVAKLHVVNTDPVLCRNRAIASDQEYLLPVIDRMVIDLLDNPPGPEWEFV